MMGRNGGRNDGMNQGMNEGMNKGMNQGMNEGMNQGMNEGMGAANNDLNEQVLSKQKKLNKDKGNITTDDIAISKKEKFDHAYNNSESDSDQSDKSFDYLSDDENEVIKLRKRMRQSKVNSTEVPDEVPYLEGTSAQGQDTTIDVDRFGEVDDTCVGLTLLIRENKKSMEALLRKLKGNGMGITDPFAILKDSKEKYPIYDDLTHWKLKKPKLGEKFPTVDKFKECLTYYALANGFSLYFERSNKEKIIDKCGQRKEVVSLIDDYCCVRNFNYGRLISYKWLGRHFGDKIRMNPQITLDQIARLVKKKYKCIMSKTQCRNAKKFALNKGEVTIQDHYGFFRSYAKALADSNEGSTVKVGVTVNPDEKTYFDRFYVCFKALKDGWKMDCRRIIALDVAWAVVSVENKDNWTWFLELIAEDLEVPNGVGLTLMYDQHKGLVEAVKDVTPLAEHRQCALHIYDGFRKQFSGVRKYKEHGLELFSLKEDVVKLWGMGSVWHMIPYGDNQFEVRRGSDAFKDRILGPKPRKMPRRPRKKMFRASHETKSNTRISRADIIIRCHNCWEIRHNKKGCKKEPIPVVPKEKKKGDRPKKIQTTEPVDSDNDIPPFVNNDINEFEMGASNSRVVFNDGMVYNVGRFSFNKKKKFGSSSRMGSWLGIDGAASDTIEETEPYQPSMPVIKNPSNFPVYLQENKQDLWVHCKEQEQQLSWVESKQQLQHLFEELSQKFLEEFSQQKRNAKDPIEIYGIKRRHNKGLQAFIDRFISESSHIKGVPPVLRISAFMHGHGHPELAKKLNDKIPKTVDEMFERVRAFIRGEVAAGSTEMVRPSQGDKGGHNTNDCYQLKKKIEEVVASGKLAHLVKDIRRNNQRSENRGKNSVKIINMIREGENRKRPYDEGRSGLTDELTFPVIPRYQLTGEPIILEGIIKGNKVQRILVDGGSSSEIMYEHCFRNLNVNIRSKIRRCRALMVGFLGETYHPLGVIDLRVTIGRAGRSKTVLMEFVIIKYRSPYNVIIGRTRMRSLGRREALWECRQLEKVQGSWKEVQWCQRKEQMSRIREQVILRTKNISERGPNSGPVSLEKTWDREDIEEVFTISHERPG
ncbi:reverse transcriptase domain-containing protein [Tanacetum coccineum]